MKTVGLLVSLYVLVPLHSYSQSTERTDGISRMALISTANVATGNSISIQAGTSAFTSDQDIYRVRGILGIGGRIELELSNVGELQTMLYRIRRQPSWDLKVKLLSESDDLPGVALAVGSSLGWDAEWNYWYNIQASRPDLYRQGLSIAKYESGFARAQAIVSKSVLSNMLLSLGVGIDDIETKSIAFWGTASDFEFPTLLRSDGMQHKLTLQGFIGAVYPITGNLSLIGEVETVPFITPNSGLTSLVADRAYGASLGLRYDLSRRFSVDGTYFGVSDPSGYSMGELRIGLNASMGLL